MHTKFALSTNPWTQQKMTKANTPHKKPTYTSLDDLSITDDAPPSARVQPGGKYSPIFAKLQPLKRLKCPTGAAGRIGQQLRKWMEKNSVPGSVKITEHYGDGAGGVWLIPAQEQECREPVSQPMPAARALRKVA